MKTKVVVVDNVADLRWLLRLNLDGDGRFEVVGEAADGREAVDVVRRTQPDVVVLDLRMPRMDGVEAATEIARASPNTKVLIHSAVGELQVVAALRHSGLVASYLAKGASPRAVVEAVVRAASQADMTGSASLPSAPSRSRPSTSAGAQPGARRSHSYRCPPPSCAPP